MPFDCSSYCSLLFYYFFVLPTGSESDEYRITESRCRRTINRAFALAKSDQPGRLKENIPPGQNPFCSFLHRWTYSFSCFCLGWEERANPFSIVYLLYCGFCSRGFSSCWCLGGAALFYSGTSVWLLRILSLLIYFTKLTQSRTWTNSLLDEIPI